MLTRLSVSVSNVLSAVLMDHMVKVVNRLAHLIYVFKEFLACVVQLLHLERIFTTVDDCITRPYEREMVSSNDRYRAFLCRITARIVFSPNNYPIPGIHIVKILNTHTHTGSTLYVCIYTVFQKNGPTFLTNDVGCDT